MLDIFTPTDILMASAAAFLLTGLVNGLIKLFKFAVNRTTEFDYEPHNRESVTKKFCALFPNEQLKFNDTLFKRGMQIRISTIRDKFIEGQFIGVNSENIICVITQHQVVAQELGMVDEIEEV
jgi:hypothetical protein